MAAGVVVYRTGENSLKKVGGLRRSMPVTFLAFTVAALSISGFPGFNGFVSKGMVVAAAHETSNYVFFGEDVLWWLLILGGVGTFASFAKFEWYAFLGSEASHDAGDANNGQKAVLLALAAACILLGVYPDVLFEMLPGDGWTAHPFTAGHIAEGFVLAAAGVGGFLAARPLLSRAGVPRDVDAVVNPIVFYGTRYTVRATVELYSAVDAFVVSLARASVDVARDPSAAITGAAPSTLSNRFEERLEETPGESGLRLGLGEGVLVLSAVLAGLLYLFI